MFDVVCLLFLLSLIIGSNFVSSSIHPLLMVVVVVVVVVVIAVIVVIVLSLVI